ncbi:hypothetical protein CRYUN_Cryun35bG0073100 [Craigia yunnanensis]
MERSPVAELGGGAEKAPRFKVKKWGVIPPARRSVKRMIFDKFVKYIFCSRLLPSCCSGAASISQPKNYGSLEGEGLKMVPYVKAKNIWIFPRKDHLLAIARQSDPSPN